MRRLWSEYGTCVCCLTSPTEGFHISSADSPPRRTKGKSGGEEGTTLPEARRHGDQHLLQDLKWRRLCTLHHGGALWPHLLPSEPDDRSFSRPDRRLHHHHGQERRRRERRSPIWMGPSTRLRSIAAQPRRTSPPCLPQFMPPPMSDTPRYFRRWKTRKTS